MNKGRKIKLGAITIGQSPRTDMVPEIKEILGNKFQVFQCGALDEYSYKDVKEKLSPEKNDNILVSKMRNGKEVILAEDKIIPLVQKCIDKLQKKNIKIILMLCTGEFPAFNFEGILIKPQPVMHKMLKGLVGDRQLGLIVPDEDQIFQIEKQWRRDEVNVTIKAASPYRSIKNIENTAREFRNENVELIFMDCMGFTRKMKEIVRKYSRKNVILPRTMIARIIKEMH